MVELDLEAETPPGLTTFSDDFRVDAFFAGIAGFLLASLSLDPKQLVVDDFLINWGLGFWAWPSAGLRFDGPLTKTFDWLKLLAWLADLLTLVAAGLEEFSSGEDDLR